MCSAVYSILFDHLISLVPNLETMSAGMVLCAPPRTERDMAAYFHITKVEGNMRMVELSDDNQRGSMVLPGPWLKLRVDMENSVAEVLEVDDAFGYQFVYGAGGAVNPRRAQINLFAANWLQVMTNFSLCFEAADMSVAS